MPCNSVAVQTAQLQYVLTLEQATQVLRGLGFSCTGELVQLYKMHSGKRVPAGGCTCNRPRCCWCATAA